MSEKNTLEDKNCYERQRTSYNDERSIYQDDITTINIWKLRTELQNNMMKYKLTELKGEIDNSAVIAGDSNILLSITDIRPEQQTQGKKKLGTTI